MGISSLKRSFLAELEKFYGLKPGVENLPSFNSTLKKIHPLQPPSPQKKEADKYVNAWSYTVYNSGKASGGFCPRNYV